MFNDFVSIFIGCLHTLLPESYHNLHWFDCIIITGLSFITAVFGFLFILITMYSIIKYILGGRNK